MHYHLILTQECNSRCRYCYEKSMIEENDLKEKWDFDFSCFNSFSEFEKLKEFLRRDKDAYLIFYGGEPLLEIEKIKKVIDECSGVVKGFRMQTNGKLLDKIPIEYLKKIDKILVSIDGDEKRTDFNRGDGNYKKVMENISLIKERGYKGEIIARMTVSFPDIYQQVVFLVDKGFNSVHWQIDAGFYKCDYSDDFEKFVEEYNKSIKKLIDYWVDEISRGNVFKLYPFIAIVDSILKNEKTGLRCGAGCEGYAISTDGKIVACPIMNCVENFVAGDLSYNKKDLKKFKIDCVDGCEVGDLCGGRCLYWREAKLWPEKGDNLVCNTIKFYINYLIDKMSEINLFIDKGVVLKSDFEYEKYFGPEIIP
jgi:uncharacterized protein